MKCNQTQFSNYMDGIFSSILFYSVGQHRPCKIVLLTLVAPRGVTDLRVYLSWGIHVEHARTAYHETCWTKYQQPSVAPVTINSGSLRMLLLIIVLIEISNLFAKKKKDQLLRAPSVGKHNSTRVYEGRKSWNLLAIKTQGTNPVVRRGGEKSLLRDPGSELRLGGRENRRAKIINGMEKNVNIYIYIPGIYI